MKELLNKFRIESRHQNLIITLENWTKLAIKLSKISSLLDLEILFVKAVFWMIVG